MARRRQQGHVERESILAGTIEVLEEERRGIASNLHDGAVQYVAGVTFGLAPIAAHADARGGASDAAQLRESAAILQRGVREIRARLIELYPPGLNARCAPVALGDLLGPLQASGVETHIEIDDCAGAGTNGDALVHRAASEALRNVRAHADARSVRVELVRRAPGAGRRVVRDDGKRFSGADRDRRATEGHVGLMLRDNLVRRSKGTRAARWAPGEGTTVELELSAP